MEQFKDHFYMCRILCYAFATVVIMCTTFFITANDYWMYKFRNTTIEGNYRTKLQAQFTSIYNGLHVVFNIFALLATIVFLRKTSIIKRITISLSLLLILFAVVTAFVEIDTDSWQLLFFVLSLLIGVLISIINGVFSVTVFQLIPKFPPQYLGAFISGTVISGIFAALAQIFALSFNVSSQGSGLIYFTIGTVFIGLTIVYFLIIIKQSPFFHYYANKQSDEVQQKIQIDRKLFVNVLIKIRYFIISLIITLGTTALFSPGLVAIVQSTDYGNGNEWNDKYFVPVISFLCFHICDLIGREVATKINKSSGQITCLLSSLIRALFLPLLLFCNEQPRHNLPVLFNDGVYIVLIILVAFSNGYLIILNSVQIQSVTEDEERNAAFLIIMVVMIISMAPFSLLSPLLVKAL